jgi:hypothetical protein
MKLIQTIIAFLSLYLFIGVFVFLGLCAAWLSTYVSDIPEQKIAVVTVGAMEGTAAPIVYYDTATTHALAAVVTRGIEQKGEKQQAVLAARSSVIISTFEKVTLSEKFVPLGFKTMYRLQEAVDSQGEVLYARPSSWIDALFLKLLQNEIKVEKQYVTLLATEKDQSYTVVVRENELVVKSTNEN